MDQVLEIYQTMGTQIEQTNTKFGTFTLEKHFINTENSPLLAMPFQLDSMLKHHQTKQH